VKFSSPPWKSFHPRQAVLEIVGVQLLLAADVEEDRDPGLLGRGPYRVEGDVAGRMARRAARGDQQGLGAQGDRLPPGLRGAVEIHQRHIGGGQEATVDGAEVGHHPVVGLGGGVAEVEGSALVEPEVAKAEGGEHQLAGEAQQVEGLGSVGAAEGAQGLVVLAQQDVVVLAGAEGGIVVLAPRGRRPPPVADLVMVDRQVVVGRQHLAIEIGIEAVLELHQVGVGVVDDAILHIGHGLVPPRFGASGPI